MVQPMGYRREDRETPLEAANNRAEADQAVLLTVACNTIALLRRDRDRHRAALMALYDAAVASAIRANAAESQRDRWKAAFRALKKRGAK